HLQFNQPVTVEINNFETYRWYEMNHAVSDGTAWTGAWATGVVNAGDAQNLVSDPSMGVADGLGSQHLILYGTTEAGFNGNGWAYGFFDSQNLRSLDLGYSRSTTGGTTANGIDVRVVSAPEPSLSIFLVGLLAVGRTSHRERRRRRFR